MGKDLEMADLEQQQKQEAHLTDLQRLPPLAPEQKQQHRKVGRANEHQHNGDNFNGQAVILADAAEFGGKAAGGQAAHGVAQAVEQRHSANHIGSRSQNQENDVHFKNGLGCLLEVRH